MIKELVTNANDIQAKEPSFYCKEWLPIPKNTLTMISAPGGTGKSFLSIQLAIRIIQELLRNDNNQKVLIWLSEDPLSITKDRIQKVISRIMNITDENEIHKILDRLDIIGAERETIYFQNLTSKQIKELGDELVTQYAVVILDPLIAFYAGEENSNSQARAFMNILNRMAQDRLLSIVLIHHHNKNGEGAKTRGASAFVDAVRLLYSVSTIKDEETEEIHPTKRLIKIEKDNWGVRMLLNTDKFEREILPYSVKEITMKSNNKEGKNKKGKKSIWEVI
jgi:replicative DNA helicase